VGVLLGEAEPEFDPELEVEPEAEPEFELELELEPESEGATAAPRTKNGQVDQEKKRRGEISFCSFQGV